MQNATIHNEGIITQARNGWCAMPCADTGYGFVAAIQPKRNYFVGENSPHL